MTTTAVKTTSKKKQKAPVTSVPEIFPIHLSEPYALRLVKEHAAVELRDATRFHSGNAEYEYSAIVSENGDVSLSVWHRDENSFCLSAGTCLRKVVRPFNAERLTELKEQRMSAIAEEEYYRRLGEQTKREIEKVKAELFGKV